MESILTTVNPQAVILGVFLLLVGLGFLKIMQSRNPLEWWHFFATRGADGHYYADSDKLWQNIGGVVGSVAILLESYNGRLDWAVFGGYLAFVGSVKGYSAYLRAKQGSVETTKVTEPAGPPSKVTETKVETPPIARKDDNT